MEDHGPNWVPPEPPSPAPVLRYHYTTAKGLVGIVQEKRFWATMIHYLNDAKEFSYALDLAAQAILRRKAASPEKKDLFDNLSRHLPTIANLHVFVFSFSEDGDLLSQWRAYCGDGQGYSLGFDFSRPDIQKRIQRHGFRFARCVYDEAEQRQSADLVLEEALITSKNGDDLVPTFLRRFSAIAPLLKHPSFAEEREWRLFSTPMDLPRDEVKIRPGRSFVMPYYELPLEKLDSPALAEVIVGPGPHKELAERALRAVPGTGSHRFSKIPFRNW